MSADPVDGLGRVMETLRRQMAAKAKETGKNGGALSAFQLATPAIATKLSLQELEGRVHARIRAIDPSDTQREQKAIRIFLESVLLWEFGDDLIRDPRFADLYDEVRKLIESDDKTWKSMRALVSQLGQGGNH